MSTVFELPGQAPISTIRPDICAQNPSSSSSSSPGRLPALTQEVQLQNMSEQAIREFLGRMKLADFPHVHDHELSARVNAAVRSWSCHQNINPNHIATALVGTMTAYSHITSIDTKVQIALFTTLVLAMDDPDVLNSLSSHEIHRNFCLGAVQSQPGMLSDFAAVLGRMWDHYPVFTANTIYSSALRFINACILENESERRALHPDVLSFIEYKRSMSATTEAYACFIWEKTRFPDSATYMQAIPDVMLYVSYVNDVLSFHKEELAGETGNYIHERAMVTGKSPAVVLREVIGETVTAVERIRSILGRGDARDAFEVFASGYVKVHTANPRYKLKEIIGSEYFEECSAL